MKLKVIIAQLILLVVLQGASISVEAKKKEAVRDISVSLIDYDNNLSRRFGNLDFGLRIQVNSDVVDDKVIDLKELPTKQAEAFPNVLIENPLTVSAEQNLDKDATALGFEVAGDIDTDYILSVTIKQCSLKVRSYDTKHKEFRSSAAVLLSWELLDADRNPVIGPTTTNAHATANTQETILNPLRDAYIKAFRGIDWNKIAPKLKTAKLPSQEKNKQVSGAGNTALEHIVIRWYIVSSPPGADVTWRVVSSTPDVHNTNGLFVGTTPYESTESFDIKGLTFNNSGNVQIEVTCEKAGYVAQRKRFNLKQAIDQKEISAKFNLVKETDDITSE